MGPLSRLRRSGPSLQTTILLLAALATGVFFTWIAHVAPRVAPSWLLPIDDAYIFVRYAQQGARGMPLQWNAGEPSTGASSFLYPWLEVPAFWLGATPETASRWAFGLGIASLWILGLAGERLLGLAGAPAPWPLATGLALVWSGPLVFGALGGMESGANAAALVWALVLWLEGSRAEATPALRRGTLALVAFLPWLRPENGVLVLAAAIALAAGRGPRLPRAASLLVLLPGALLAGIDLLVSGHLSPAGVLAKSRLGAPFVDLPLLGSLWAYGLGEWIAPVYAGARAFVLPPPVGWLAAVGAFLALRAALKRPVRGTSLDWRSLGPTALAWLALVFLAPFSSIPHWHYWRHHHGGLALAWILAMACAADLVERWRMERAVRWRLVSLVAPLVLFLGLPGWGLRYAEGMDVLWQRNGRGATWIRALEGRPVLLVDDAGLLALYHDGPLIDAVGLGSHGLALPFRHGPGSLLEALARRSPAPEIAAVHQGLFRIPELLGERLRDPAVPGDVVIARVRRDRLASTLLAGPGVDFGLLKDETALSWDPPPHANQASFALLRPTATGQEVLGGCRPLRGTLQAALPFDGPVTLRVTALDEQPTSIRIRVRGAPGSKLVERTVPLAATEWTDATLEKASPGPATLELQRLGPGVPCLESLF